MKQSATKKAQARVLAKAQQITVNFRILDDAELLDIIANFRGLCAHICMDKFLGANQDPTASLKHGPPKADIRLLRIRVYKAT